MSSFLKQAEYFGGGTGFLNQVLDSTVTGQPDLLGIFGGGYGGGLVGGDYLRLNDAEALALSATAVGTLLGGTYRRVFCKAGITGGGTTGFKRGQIVFWDFLTAGANNYQVTNVEATDAGLIAGFIINATDTAGAPLSGNWVWIQTAGIVTAQLKATVTDVTNFDGAYWAAAGAGADNGVVDSLADATAVTGTLIRRFIGTFLQAPANGALKQVNLRYDFSNARP